MSNNDRRRNRRRQNSRRPLKPAVPRVKIDTDALRELGNRVKVRLPAEYGFALLIFPHGEHDHGQIRYVGDCDRPDVLNMMTGWVAVQRNKAQEKATEADLEAQGLALATFHAPMFEKIQEAYFAKVQAGSNEPTEPLPEAVKAMLQDALGHGFSRGMVEQMNNPFLP